MASVWQHWRWAGQSWRAWNSSAAGTDKKAAMRLAEKIRSEIQQSRYVLRRMEGTVTASLGVAVYPDDGITHDALMGAADKNLYRAKNAGRNRVCGSI